MCNRKYVERYKDQSRAKEFLDDPSVDDDMFVDMLFTGSLRKEHFIEQLLEQIKVQHQTINKFIDDIEILNRLKNK